MKKHPIIIISSEEKVPSEIRKIVVLFESGLEQFHIRKPHFSDFDMINFLGSIPTKYHQFIVLHSHYHLAKEFACKGIQVGQSRLEEAKTYLNEFKHIGYSAHTFAEVLQYKALFTQFFISPIYDSISKQGYAANFEAEALSNFMTEHEDIDLVALGGLTKDNALETLNLGFKSLALLGHIWESEDVVGTYEALKASLNSGLNKRPLALTIAGFDPSSGAGVTADIKTFEQHKVQALAINTAITYQNESEFEGVDWLSFAQIKKQLDVLMHKYHTEYVKIGLIENLEVLKALVQSLKEDRPQVKIIWDPILKASAGFNFHEKIHAETIREVLKGIHLLTPNIPEAKQLFGTADPKEIQAIVKAQDICKVLLKGGHSANDEVLDTLIEAETITVFEGKRLNTTKHGTGCVLSSAICSNLALGFDLKKATQKAKTYIEQFIDSNQGLLGYHH